MGLNSAFIAELDQVINEGRWALWRHGYLVHLEGDFNANTDTRSSGKTFHAMTIGAFVEMGKIGSIEQPLSDWGMGRDGGPDNCHATATLRQVMAQVSAFDYEGLCPGDIWTYSDANYYPISDVAARAWRGTNATPGRDNYTDVIGPVLLNRIGASGWVARPGTSFIHLDMDLEDFGRLGMLLVSRGMWGHERILPEWYVDELGQKQTYGALADFDNGNGGKNRMCHATDPGLDEYAPDDPCRAQGFTESPYGLFTWVNTDQDVFPKADASWALAMGSGGSILAWHPESGVVFALLDSRFNLNRIPEDDRPGSIIKARRVIEPIQANILGPNPLVSQP